MTIKELNSRLKKLNVSKNRYYLQGLYGSTNDDDKIALVCRQIKNITEYEVYFKERGEKSSSQKFKTEDEACKHIFHKIQEELTFERVQKIPNLGGMTVNERLYMTELTEEFDWAKKNNKTRATQILRIIRVDEPSIKKILN